ncbi:MAG TPA: bile acid:sodium symporter family protein [Planctomycetes bacterium]|nr:bile acid:sodium symporter family protein [Planctomycetota bacterium]
MINRILKFYTKYFALWVLLFAVFAYLMPAPFESLSAYNQWFFALTMFGIGAVLSPDDFERIAKQPRIVLVGSAAQFTIMPLGAFAVAKIFNLQPQLAVGLILAGCMPGAMASNVMSYIAGADAAYSVSLTAVSTLLCPIITPALTKLLAGAILPVDFWRMFADVVFMVVLPLAVGFSVRAVLKEKIDKLRHVFPAVSVTFIIFICSVVIAANRQRLGLTTLYLLVPVFVLNIYGMSAGFALGTACRFSPQRRRTLSIEIGMQNAGLGTVLAIEHFGEKSAIPAAMFVFVCIITASIMAEFWQRNKGDVQ